MREQNNGCDKKEIISIDRSNQERTATSRGIGARPVGPMNHESLLSKFNFYIIETEK